MKNNSNSKEYIELVKAFISRSLKSLEIQNSENMEHVYDPDLKENLTIQAEFRFDKDGKIHVYTAAGEQS